MLVIMHGIDQDFNAWMIFTYFMDLADQNVIHFIDIDEKNMAGQGIELWHKHWKMGDAIYNMYIISLMKDIFYTITN